MYNCFDKYMLSERSEDHRMPNFKFSAKDYSLNKISGEISASSERDARIQLKEQGLFVLDISEMKEKKERKSLLDIDIVEKKVKLEELTLFSRQFATLVDAGVPIVRSLNILSLNSSNKTLKKALAKVTEDIEAGLPLSKSLAAHPKIFPLMYTDMIAAAEVGGALPEVLDRLAGYLEKDKSIKSKVKAAFTYPAIVSVVAVLAVVIVLLFVIPQFIPLFEDMGEELPLPTRILLGSSEFFLNYWYIALAAVVVIGVAFAIYQRTAVGKIHIDYIKLKIPIIGNVVTKSTIARFSRTLETLQRSGVPLVEALSIVGKASGNYHVEQAVLKALYALERGEQISKPLAKSWIFPPLVTQMIEIGEETGELEALLSKVADFYEEEVEIAVKNLTSLIEPVITVFLGAMVGFIAVAVIMPIYDLMAAMQEEI